MPFIHIFKLLNEMSLGFFSPCNIENDKIAACSTWKMTRQYIIKVLKSLELLENSVTS